jgi:hypothetical protein
MRFDWWANGLRNVNEMHVATTARRVTGRTPMSVAMPMAMGVRIDAAAELVTTLVISFVVRANTMTTRATLPADRCLIPSAMTAARPLVTTTAPRPTDPARMNSTFQSRARAADAGVSTPVRTISSAPLNETSSTGASPNDAARTTATNATSAIQVIRGWGVLPATSCQIATAPLARNSSALAAVTKQVAPGIAAVSLKGLVVCAAMTRMSASSLRSRSVPRPSELTEA